MAGVESHGSAKAERSGGSSFSPSRSLAIILCLFPVIYCLAIMAYALLNFSDYGADVPRFLRYIVAPGLIAAAFMLAAVLLPPRKGANVGLAASAVLIALLIVEFILNVRMVISMVSLASMLGAGPSGSEEIARGRDGIPPTYTSKNLSSEMEVETLEQALLGGIPGEEVLLCSQEGAPLYYTADRYGFNNDDAVHDTSLEIMIVGDSFVEGYCQDRPDTFAGKMRDLRPRTASIGMRGGGPLYELALIGRYGQEFQPDWVAMAFFAGNDWENLQREAGTPWLAEALTANPEYGSTRPTSQQVELAGRVIDELWAKDISARDVFAKSSFVRNIVALNQIWGLVGLDYPKVSHDQPIYGDILGRAKAMTESWGGKFVLVYIPQEVRYRGWLDKSFLYDDVRSDVLNAAAAHDVEVVDLTEVFAEADNPSELFASDGHFSPAGSTVAARALNARISALENQKAALASK